MRVCEEALARFLKTLAATGNVTQAANAAGLPRSSLYQWRERDTHFAAAWNEAIEAATDALEAEARRRAVEGVETAVIRGGRMVLDEEGNPITIRRYSDNLLAMLLRAHRPEKFGDRTASGSGDAEAGNVTFTFRIGERGGDHERGDREGGNEEEKPPSEKDAGRG